MRSYLEAGGTLADEAAGPEQEARQVLADPDKLEPAEADFEKTARPVPRGGS